MQTAPATATLSNGTSQDVTAQAAWSSSNTAVATVTTTGLLRVLQVGVATITATYQNRSALLLVSVPYVTLSGTVYESTPNGNRPLPGVGIDVSAELQPFPPQTTTDAQGHYQVSKTAGDFKVRAELAGYSQPCRTAVTLAASSPSGVIDVYMVRNELLSTTGVPSSMPVHQPTLTGVVFERTEQGSRPIAGATVIADVGGGDGYAVVPIATTMSDAAGRYLLCGVESVTSSLAVYASAPGYRNVDVPVSVPTPSTFDVELARQ